jgi:hypothetical protein
MLETERNYFDRIRPGLLELGPTMFVVIKGETLIGTYSTFDQALQEGAIKCGTDDPFLVRRVDQQTENISIPALAVGILHADTANSI